MPNAPEKSGATSPHSGLASKAALLTVLFLLSWSALSTTNVAIAAAPAPTNITQCGGTDNAGGEAVACTVAVINQLDLATGTGSSTTTVKQCHGAARAIVAATCTVLTTQSAQPVTSVTQCDGSGSGGGGTVDCAVDIVNNITGAAAITPATVNQCIGSGTGGGAESLLCEALSTSHASISQCNGSGNGGGGTQRVRCTTEPSLESTSLPMTIRQCNGSGNGGGSVLTCSASLKTNVAVAPVTSPPVTSPPITAPPITTPPATVPPVTAPVAKAPVTAAPIVSGTGQAAPTKTAPAAATAATSTDPKSVAAQPLTTAPFIGPSVKAPAASTTTQESTPSTSATATKAAAATADGAALTAAALANPAAATSNAAPVLSSNGQSGPSASILILIALMAIMIGMQAWTARRRT